MVVIVNEELFEIPGYSQYRITKSAKVYSLNSNRFLEGSVNNGGYLQFRIVHDSGRVRTQDIHRLMGYAFLPCPGDFKDYQVNHKNGIKSDVSVENLEWVKFIDNLHHAGKEGLTSKCIPIEMRDVDTLEVKRYPSVIACARDLGVTKDYVKWRVDIGPSRIFPERKQYRKLTEEWVDVNDPRLKLYNTSKSTQLLTYSLVSGEEREFRNMRELAEYLKVGKSTLASWLNKMSQPVVPGFIMVKKRSDPNPWDFTRDPYRVLEKLTGSRIVLSINSATGEKRLHHSVAECAMHYGIKPASLSHRLNADGGESIIDNIRFKYRTLRRVP